MRRRRPAEWEQHRAVWLAWPYLEEEWPLGLQAARRQLADLCTAISRPTNNGSHPEQIELLVHNDEAEETARKELGSLVRYHRVPYGDAWVRDTGPLFTLEESGKLVASCFRFDGYGGRKLLNHNSGVGERIAEVAGVSVRKQPLVLEGGGIDVDGEGTALTTHDCSLGRNAGVTSDALESVLREELGVSKVLILSGALQNDPTNGHIDTLARFVAPGVVVCMEPTDGDPNREVLAAVHRELSGVVDARGRTIDVVSLPSPGAIHDPIGKLVPASFCNFYIGNTAVVVPAYGSPADTQAVEVLSGLFSTRAVVSVDAQWLVCHGGAFHCLTQEEPMGGGS